MEKQQILNDIKAYLEEARLLAKEHASLIGNSQMHIHIGSIQNKWLGGIGNLEIVVPESAPESTQAVFKPTPDHFKKKGEVRKSRLAATEPDDDLNTLGLSELKVMAKEMGLSFKEKDKRGLIEIIRFAKRGEEDMKRIPKKRKGRDEEE